MLWGIGALLVAAVAAPVEIRTRWSEQCLLCRIQRIHKTFVGFTSISEVLDSEFTAWYLDHESPHECRWSRRGCAVGMGLVGRRYSCGPSHELFLTPGRLEREFLEKADPESVQGFWKGVLSPDWEEQRQAVQEMADWALASLATP